MQHTAPKAAHTLPHPPSERRALEAYAAWLFYERRILCSELFPGLKNADAVQPDSQASDFHFGGSDPRGWYDRPLPSTRAEQMLAAVGIDWTKHKHRKPGPFFDHYTTPRPAEPGFPEIDAALIAADRRHRDLSDMFNTPGLSDAERDRLTVEMMAAERALIGGVSESLDGYQAKARTLQRLMAPTAHPYRSSPPEGLDDIGRLTWSLLADLLHLRSRFEQVVEEQNADLAAAGLLGAAQAEG